MRGMWLLAGLIVLLAILPTVNAATIGYRFDRNTVVPTEFGDEIINGHPANLTLIITTPDGKPFNASAFPDPANTSISVTVQFMIGDQVVDVTGDGNPDVFVAVEDPSNPGQYKVTINTSARPGEYTMRVHAIATNSNTGQILDEGRLDVDVYISDPYWVTTWCKEGDEIKIGSLSLKIDTVNDRGAVLIMGGSLVNLSRDNTTGLIYRKVDLDGDGIATDWMFIKSDKDTGLTEVKFYSRNPGILGGDEDNVTVSGNKVVRTTWLKDRNRYRVVILWDKSPFSWIKAEDYYIIPAKNPRCWKEGWGRGYSGKVTVIKRTTWFNFISTDEKVFEGNIFGRNVKIDKTLDLFGRWFGNKARFGWGWEVWRGIARLVYPKDYQLKFRSAATVSDLEFRGDLTLKSVNWDAILQGTEGKT